MERVVASFIPIVAIVMGIGVALWGMYLDYQRKRLQYEERRLMIEKGMAPPALPPDAPRHTPEASLRTGIVTLFLGIGFGLAALIWQGPEIFSQPRGPGRALAVAGSIVALLGIGNLVYYTIAAKRPRSLPPAA